MAPQPAQGLMSVIDSMHQQAARGIDGSGRMGAQHLMPGQGMWSLC